MASDLPGTEMNSVTDTSAAAPPPTPLKMATICGMAVIFTSRAAGTPMTAPMAMAMMMSTRLRVCEYTSGSENVHATATTMPARPHQVPEPGALGRAQALEGQDEPDDGDEVDEVGGGAPAHDGVPALEPGAAGVAGRVARRGAVAAGALRSVRLGPEHVEHPVGHHEPAHDVEGGQDDGEEARASAGRARAPCPARAWCRRG